MTSTDQVQELLQSGGSTAGPGESRHNGLVVTHRATTL